MLASLRQGPMSDVGARFAKVWETAEQEIQKLVRETASELVSDEYLPDAVACVCESLRRIRIEQNIIRDCYQKARKECNLAPLEGIGVVRVVFDEPILERGTNTLWTSQLFQEFLRNVLRKIDDRE